jgi:hypothetical protein
VSGRVYLAENLSGGPPAENREAWGWPDGDTRPIGRDLIGWVTGDGDVYLDPEASHRAAQKAATDGNQPLSHGATALNRMLFDKQLIVAGGEKDGRLQVRRTVGRRRRRVLQLTPAAIDALLGDGDARDYDPPPDRSIPPLIDSLGTIKTTS